ncbi:hypothetical protein ABKN59_008981 [Abortiporus biennis]
MDCGNKRSFSDGPEASSSSASQNAKRHCFEGSSNCTALSNDDKCSCSICLRKNTRSRKHWMKDGSVIIQVQNRLFRLYRSRLEQQSTFFEEFFHDIGEETDPQEEIDGCPVYKINYVNAVDFENLLTAVESGLAYAHEPPSFQVLASILRASSALSFNVPKAFVTKTLVDMWPSDISSVTDTRIPHAAETVVLARKFEMEQVLKRSMYELLRTDGFGQVKTNEDHTSQDGEDDRNISLGTADLLVLISAREKLQREFISIADAPLTMPCRSRQEESRAQCSDARAKQAQTWKEEVKKRLIVENGLLDPLCALEKLSSEIDWAKFNFCDVCVAARTTFWERKRKVLWHKLDEWLGLGPANPDVKIEEHEEVVDLSAETSDDVDMEHKEVDEKQPDPVREHIATSRRPILDSSVAARGSYKSPVINPSAAPIPPLHAPSFPNIITSERSRNFSNHAADRPSSFGPGGFTLFSSGEGPPRRAGGIARPEPLASFFPPEHARPSTIFDYTFANARPPSDPAPNEARNRPSTLFLSNSRNGDDDGRGAPSVSSIFRTSHPPGGTHSRGSKRGGNNSGNGTGL